MSDTVTLGVFALVATAIPLTFSLWQKKVDNRQKAIEREEARKSKKEDWDRQDAVAKQAAEAARLLLAANERVAKTSGEVKDQLSNLDQKVDVVKTWVDGKLTEEKQNHLDEIERSLVGLVEIVRLNKNQGNEPSSEALGVIKATKERIDKLKIEIKDRHEKQKRIDEQVSVSKSNQE